jgi:superfamily II DNA or RNA helicase
MSETELDAEALLARARAVIATEILDAESTPAVVGEVRLHPHQRRAVGRVRALLHSAGGALLADSTGLGKTFVALAVAAGTQRVLIIGPASLAESWRFAMTRTHVEARFISLEQLSRKTWAPPIASPELVIIDEAHHVRNPRTKCYAAVATICERADVLLLSATPLQNRRADLVAQLALFLGDEAARATDAELAPFIVRRRADDTSIRLPAIRGPRWVQLPITDDRLDDLVALPPPVAGSDEGTAGALVTYTLLRQWSSSRAALIAALRRRLARAIALMSSLEAGRWPTREQLAAWSHAEQAVQLAFPEMLTPLGADSADVGGLLAAVRAHADALRGLITRLIDAPNPDPYRADVIAEICRAHPSARVLAFSQYAETVRALSRLLMTMMSGVAALTAHGGRVAGGRISRREVLAQFTPSAKSDAVPAADRIGLLVTTDVLSEGLDLQRASVVVHLDLPWNPARLEQRVGRVRRLGAAHDAVFVYALAPPVDSERILRVVDRLRAKMGLAASIVGVDFTVVPDVVSRSAFAPPELESVTLELLDKWRASSDSNVVPTPIHAGASASSNGFVALLAIGRERLLLASLDGTAPSLDPSTIGSALRMCLGPAITLPATAATEAMAVIRTWCSEWSARRRIGAVSAGGARLRVAVAARISAFLASAPRHQRAVLVPLASRAQQALRITLGAGAERTLLELSREASANPEWLRRIAALSESRRRRRSAADEPELLVLVFLRRSRPEANAGDLSGAASPSGE